MNLWKILLKVSAAISFVFFLPYYFTILLGGVIGLAVCALILAIANSQDESAPNSNDNINTCANEEIIDSDNSKVIINEIQTCNIISSTSAIFKGKIQPSSSEIQLPDLKLHTSSKSEDQLPHCTEMKNETTKDMNSIVAKSSDEKFIPVEQTENVHQILTLTNLLDNLPGEHTAADTFPASSTKDEVSTGYPVFSNDSDIISSTSSIFKDKIQPRSSEIQLPDIKLHASSKPEDQLPHCTEMKNETTKDMNSIVAKSSDEKFIPVEQPENVHQILTLTNLLDNLPGDHTAPDIFPASSTKDEVSTGYPVFSNDSDIISSTSSIFKVKIQPSSSEIQLPDLKLHASSKPEDQLLHFTEMRKETTKDMNSINPIVAKSSDENLIPVEQTENLPEDHTAPDIFPASSTVVEVSTGYPVSSNDSDTTIEKVQIVEEKSENMKTIELKKREQFGKDVSHKYPLDTIPMEFIYPCLPYQY